MLEVKIELCLLAYLFEVHINLQYSFIQQTLRHHQREAATIEVVLRGSVDGLAADVGEVAHVVGHGGDSIARSLQIKLDVLDQILNWEYDTFVKFCRAKIVPY